MNTGEGNKLIADFMGIRTRLTSRGFLTTIPDENSDFQYVEYHSSWDWLMPVVEKIYDLYNRESNDWLSIIIELDDFPDIFQLKITESIKSVYSHVIDFIQWYNKNNPHE